jgi:hypothetical protein
MKAKSSFQVFMGVVFVLTAALVLAGCGGKKDFEVTVENKSGASANFALLTADLTGDRTDGEIVQALTPRAFTEAKTITDGTSEHWTIERGNSVNGFVYIYKNGKYIGEINCYPGKTMITDTGKDIQLTKKSKDTWLSFFDNRMYAQAGKSTKGSLVWGEQPPAGIAEASENDFESVNLTDDGAGVHLGLYKRGRGDDLVIPATVQGMPVRIIDGAYENIKSVVIPEGVHVIGQSAFKDCKNLTSITLPNSIEIIGSWAFASSGITVIGQWPASLLMIGGYAFTDSLLTELVLPDDVELQGDTPASMAYFDSYDDIQTLSGTVGGCQFSNCENLKSVTIGANVKLTSFIFYSCESLETIILKGPVFFEKNNNEFAYCPKLNLVSQKTLKDAGYSGSF